MRFSRERQKDYVVCTDVTPGWAILGLAGKKAADILAAAGSGVPAELKFFYYAPVEIGLARGFVGRLSYTGQPGFELYIPADMAMAAHAALIDAGATHAGLLASSSLRIEAGFRAWGHELAPGTTPRETGLDRFLAWNTDFIGRDALHNHQPQRQVATLVFEDPDAIPLHDEPVFYEREVVGQITSAAWNYSRGRSVALAMLRASLEKLGEGNIVEGFEVEIACERHVARASLSPLKDW